MANRKNRRFRDSFVHAMAGVWYGVRHERNFRFHIAAALLVVTFACFYGLTRTEWALLAMAIAAVMAAELLNTGVEQSCDAQTERYDDGIKAAKDAAAGAVWLVAGGAVAVGICLFGDMGRIMTALARITQNTGAIAIVCVVLVMDVFLLLFGGKRNDK